MVAGRPWYAAYPADFLMATQHYDLEIKGAYRILIDLLNDRDRPIPDEPRFIAGVLGCSTQKWKKIRARLIRDGKLTETGDGYLTNPRFEREHEERQTKRAEAVEHGRAGGKISAARRAGQGELEMDENETRKPNKVATKLKESSNLVGSEASIPKRKASENKGAGQPPPQAPYAREESRDQSLSPHPTPVIREETDLEALFDRVCKAAGFVPVSPAQRDLNMKQVESWIKLGVDFDKVVIPTIESMVSKTTEPTRYLGRFRTTIALEHAKATTERKPGRAYQPPAKPILDPEGEDPMFRPIRAALLERLGVPTYCSIANAARFEDARENGEKRKPLRVSGPQLNVEQLTHGQCAPVMRSVAKAHGFTEVW